MSEISGTTGASRPAWVRTSAAAAQVATVIATLDIVRVLIGVPVAGGPSHGLPGCPYVLNNHGTLSCVSHAAYLHAGGVERFAVAIVTGS
jgi:hypothetical protein